MEQVKTIDEFLFEKFNEDVNIWFDIISDNNIHWKKTDILKYVKVAPTVKSFDNLTNFVNNMKETLSGKDELISFFANVRNKLYKNEFRFYQGNVSVISETLSLLRQALEY